MITARRLIRAEPSFGILTKLMRVSWSYVLLLCMLAGVGYVALYSAGGGSPEPYAYKHIMRFAFGLVMMLSIALLDIRFIARFSWPIYAVSIALLVLVLRIGHVGKGAAALDRARRPAAPAQRARQDRPAPWRSPPGSTTPAGSASATRSS